MKLIAINVAIIFPISAPLKTANAYLNTHHPEGFQFDVDHKPHLTLLQDFIEHQPGNLSAFKAALKPILMAFNEINAIAFDKVSKPPGLSPSLLVGRQEKAISKLHNAVLKATKSFSTALPPAPELADAFAETPSKSGIA